MKNILVTGANGQLGQSLQLYKEALAGCTWFFCDKKDLNILIPGAGMGYEAIYLHQKGYTNVHVLDIAKKPLAEIALKCENFPEDHLHCTNFFDFQKEPFDMILEQTFFCAIATDKRNEYAKKVHSLLKTNGKLVGLMFNAPMYSDHPPFGGSAKEYKTYFSSLFNYKYFEPAHNSISSRNGKELFVNLIKK